MEKSIYTGTSLRFRQLLIRARKAAALTQTELAERLGEFQSFVSRYERGERRLDVVEFLQVARAIGIDPHRIIRELMKPPERTPR
ncbi:MAG: helix-turn-helix transcriptional regulator [Deltaproteobacteria bacterium]|nr:helix-turn-helix transcriptional regulator [Deltaproteobacteria bacterium]